MEKGDFVIIDDLKGNLILGQIISGELIEDTTGVYYRLVNLVNTKGIKHVVPVEDVRIIEFKDVSSIFGKRGN